MPDFSFIPPKDSETPILSWKDLFIYDHSGNSRGPLNLKLEPGNTVLILEKNVNLIHTLIAFCMSWRKPDKGTISWWLKEVPSRQTIQAFCLFQREIGLVYRPDTLFSSKTLIENLCLDLEYNQKLLRPEARKKAHLWLQHLGLQSEAEIQAHNLPEPSRRLALYALALCREPRIFLMERPAQFLDSNFQKVWLLLLAERERRGMSLMVFDREHAPYHSDDFTSIIKLDEPQKNIFQASSNISRQT